MSSSTRRPRRPRQPPLPANWRERHELPSLAVLERLSRVDDDQDAEPVPEPTDGQLERLEADQVDDQGDQLELDLSTEQQRGTK